MKTLIPTTKIIALIYLGFTIALASCSSDETTGTEPDPEISTGLLDNFNGDGGLIDYITNNASSLPEVGRVSGRYHANLTDNAGDKTLHFNLEQGRLDAKLVSFPFEFIARNIGIGTQQDVQLALPHTTTQYNFCGVQVHVPELDSRNSSHIVVGHRGSTGFTIEGKNTVDGSSSVNDIGANTVPNAKADLRIVGNEDRSLTIYWQIPNLTQDATNDAWSLYNGTGNLPGTAPAYDSEVYIGLITYASGQAGVPFVGVCDAIEIK